MLDYIRNVFSVGAGLNRLNMVSTVTMTPSMATPALAYDLMEAYYQNNGLYEDVAKYAYYWGAPAENIAGFGNPAFRTTEFYPAKLWPGALPDALTIVTSNQRIIKPIQQIWQWSNWTNKKQLAARWIAMYGDLFIKVAQREKTDTQDGRVYFDLIRPRDVIEMDVDERGFLTYIRIDIPKEERKGDKVEHYIHTEIWSKNDGTYRVYKHGRGIGVEVGQLGQATTISLDKFGIDFLPFVYAPFRDIGHKRAAGCFSLQLDKVDEINRMTTRLHSMLFRYNKALWAVTSNMMDVTRRPMPAPRIQGDDMSAPPNPNAQAPRNMAWLEGEAVLYIPGLAKMESMIPNINWQAHKSAIDDQCAELEYDLPELVYYRVMRNYTEASGRALSYILGPAIDRVVEARGNAESALSRADAMALTIAKAAGYEDFQDIGDYGAKDPKKNFEHSFQTRDVVVLNDVDRGEAMRNVAEAAERKHNMQVPYERIWREDFHYDEEEIEQNKEWYEEERKQALDNQVNQATAMAEVGVALQPGQSPGNTSPQPAPPVGTRSGQAPNRPPKGVQSRNDPRIAKQ